MQTKKKYLHLLLLFLPFILNAELSVTKHPFYLSVTEINVDSKTKKIQVSCKVFTDDLQQGLHHWLQKAVNLEKKSPSNDSLLARYAKQYLQVFVSKNEIDFTYLGYEIEEEAVWFYLEGSAKNIGNEMKVIHQLLCHAIPTQSNLIHCTFNKTRQSHKLNCPEKVIVFRF
ncbi:MAG: DUF6702 family protein [Bacteroidia bacterium]